MKLKTLLVAMIATGVCAPAFSKNLMQVYQQALANDPTFAIAHATWLSAKENLPIAQAELLPSLDVQGIGAYNYSNALGVRPNSYSLGYSLTLNQEIFNYASWKAVASASSGVKAATATYAAAAQSLIFRTAQAYFNVLRAHDELRYTIAERNSLYSQLKTNRQKYHVGLIAITSVYDAEARYDAAVAQEISNRNALANAIEDLRAITGQHYNSIFGFSEQVPLTTPLPNNIDQWEKTAEQQNYLLASDHYSMISAKQTIGAEAGARYPNLALQGTLGQSKANATAGQGYALSNTGAATLTLDFPVFQGGLVTANTRQAEANYLKASSQLELDHRTVVSSTRQDFLGVISGISKIKADKLAIVSSRKLLKATRAGYTVGTRTMVDVLDALSTVYQNETTYADDQYDYITTILKLKQDAGTLSVADLKNINHLLTKHISLSQALLGSEHVKHAERRHAMKYHAAHNTNQHLVAHHHATKMAHGNANIGAVSDKAFYAVQFFAGETAMSAYKYQQALGNTLPLDIYKVSNHGTTYYKVVYGHFVSRRQAEMAAQKLPLALHHKPHFVAKIS